MSMNTFTCEDVHSRFRYANHKNLRQQNQNNTLTPKPILFFPQFIWIVYPSKLVRRCQMFSLFRFFVSFFSKGAGGFRLHSSAYLNDFTRLSRELQ